MTLFKAKSTLLTHRCEANKWWARGSTTIMGDILQAFYRRCAGRMRNSAKEEAGCMLRITAAWQRNGEWKITTFNSHHANCSGTQSRRGPGARAFARRSRRDSSYQSVLKKKSASDNPRPYARALRLTRGQRTG